MKHVSYGRGRWKACCKIRLDAMHKPEAERKRSSENVWHVICRLFAYFDIRQHGDFTFFLWQGKNVSLHFWGPKKKCKLTFLRSENIGKCKLHFWTSPPLNLWGFYIYIYMWARFAASLRGWRAHAEQGAYNEWRACWTITIYIYIYTYTVYVLYIYYWIV